MSDSEKDNGNLTQQATPDVSTSPDRYSFSMERYQANLLEDPDDESSKSMIEFYMSSRERDQMKYKDPEWQKDNMEYDLLTTDWILEKVRKSESYAQNLYAAMCNNEFMKLDVLPILKEQKWGCSWRYGGGIVANMRQEGDYIDWYCSGIRNDVPLDDDEYQSLTKEQQEFYIISKAYVAESVVTDEIREDLLKLGWLVTPYSDDE
jgi:hypothetical protein